MLSFKEQYGFTEEEWEAYIKVLNQLKDNLFENPNKRLFSTLVTKVVKAAKKQKGRNIREETKKVGLSSVLAQNAKMSESLYGDEYKDPEHYYTCVNVPKKCYGRNTDYFDVHSFALTAQRLIWHSVGEQWT